MRNLNFEKKGMNKVDENNSCPLGHWDEDQEERDLRLLIEAQLYDMGGRKMYRTVMGEQAIAVVRVERFIRKEESKGQMEASLEKLAKEIAKMSHCPEEEIKEIVENEFLIKTAKTSKKGFDYYKLGLISTDSTEISYIHSSYPLIQNGYKERGRTNRPPIASRKETE